MLDKFDKSIFTSFLPDMVIVKKVELHELDTLLQYSKKTFYEFFAHLNDPNHFEAYVAVAFTPEKMLSELTNPDSEFYFALIDGEIACYVKLNYNGTQNEFKDENGLEVENTSMFQASIIANTSAGSC